MASMTTTATAEHTCHGAVFCGTPRDRAQDDCPACATQLCATCALAVTGDEPDMGDDLAFGPGVCEGCHRDVTVFAMRLDPQEGAALALRTTSTRGLLRTAYALTHQMHALPSRDETRSERADLRHQRDAIDAELLRRAGE